MDPFYLVPLEDPVATSALVRAFWADHPPRAVARPAVEASDISEG